LDSSGNERSSWDSLSASDVASYATDLENKETGGLSEGEIASIFVGCVAAAALTITRFVVNEHRDRQKDKRTYNRRDSQMVTHSSTSRPIQCLCMAERTGCPVLTDLWSYVTNHKISKS
jgi:hypothetical protein